jgi:putative FmdB family regulatory protein
MPIYEYECSACQHHVEVTQKISEPPLKTCQQCGQQALEKLISRTSFQLKGGGWHNDLYSSASKESKKPDDGGPGKSDDGGPKKSDDGGPGKSDDGGSKKSDVVGPKTETKTEIKSETKSEAGRDSGVGEKKAETAAAPAKKVEAKTAA